MKIAVSSKGKITDNSLDPRFGRCEFFQIYDTEVKATKIVKNKGQEASGGAGIAAANQLIDEEVDIIITGSLGPNAFEIMEKADIKAYKCESIAITDALEKYNNNELEEITIAGKAHHGVNA
ncbi:diguanylate cyclase [Clostridium chromiireducens]|uniref:Diguanylate cyclase n=1 Tax=Clostridium chromiireducens TaxID=225345 RepID=A0A399IRV3_9CLOT|nr:NifB/NifX family molybdenum-iron cluster-binding protein [Clostridium chromiireducens]RII35778.1 diguanylate cyclase [Clostridium chromiireducens]